MEGLCPGENTHTHAHMCMHTTRAWAHTVPSLAHLGSDVESPECRWDGYAGRLKNSGLRGENCSYWKFWGRPAMIWKVWGRRWSGDRIPSHLPTNLVSPEPFLFTAVALLQVGPGPGKLSTVNKEVRAAQRWSVRAWPGPLPLGAKTSRHSRDNLFFCPEPEEEKASERVTTIFKY